jgi:colanic acid biosynthesis glycosyl transferase WcaI
LRILVVTQYFWPENFRINDLVEGLMTRGHEVTDFLANRAIFQNFKGATIVRAPIFPRRQGALFLALNYISFVVSAIPVGIWKLRGQKFDLILSVMLSPATAALPAIVLRSVKKLPHISWVLDLWPDSIAAVGVIRSGLVLSWIGRLVGFIYKKTDIVLAQSKTFFDNIKKYGGESVRIEYFPGWAELDFHQTNAKSAKAAEIESTPGTFKILFAGNIGEAQDFPAILSAVEYLQDRKDIHWVFVGDGRKAEWVREELVRRGLNHLVSMPGRFPMERMPSFLSSANLLLVSLKPDPIFAMTIPGKVQSYLAMGVPVVAMLDGEGARIIEEAGAGLTVPAGDSRGLATQIEKMVGMGKGERKKMGDLGKIYSDREFNREHLITALERLMQALVKDQPRNRDAKPTARV